MKVYDGSCHCGNIKYTVALDEALSPEGKGTINRCNCSICTKNGYFLIYPRREDVIFKDGCDRKMKSYFFGKKLKPHRFCPECSSSILIDFQNSDVEDQLPLLAMNASQFKNIDLSKAAFTYFDGMNQLDPPYDN